MSPEAVVISVLVRTFNSEKPLPRLLDALDLGAGDEVIVVDSGSTDRTLAAAAESNARIFHAPAPFNYSKSLNIGFLAAHNPWVLVISSHALPLVPNLLAIFRDAAAKFPPDIVAGYGTNQVDRRPPQKGPQARYFSATEFSSVIAQCGNANALYRRTAWEEHRFDETIRTGEDHLWLADRVRHGVRFAIIPAARTLNRNAYSLRYMYRKGYSETLAHSHSPMPLRDVFLTCGSLTKSLLIRGMPLGTWVRLLAHTWGRYAGADHEPDNRPW